MRGVLCPLETGENIHLPEEWSLIVERCFTTAYFWQGVELIGAIVTCCTRTFLKYWHKRLAKIVFPLALALLGFLFTNSCLCSFIGSQTTVLYYCDHGCKNKKMTLYLSHCAMSLCSTVAYCIYLLCSQLIFTVCVLSWNWVLMCRTSKHVTY